MNAASGPKATAVKTHGKNETDMTRFVPRCVNKRTL